MVSGELQIRWKVRSQYVNVLLIVTFKIVMSFNVHRRNKSLVSQNRNHDKREQKSHLKIGLPSGDTLLQDAKNIYYSQTNLDEAARLFQHYLVLHPRNNEALYLCAVSYLHIGMSQLAIDRLAAISDEYQNKPNAILLAAMALNKLGSVSRSLQMVSECIRKYENFEEAICFRGKIYMNMNFYHKAEQDFKLSINLSKASFLSYVGLADCYRFQGKVEKALTMYYKSLEILGQKDSQREINHKPEIQMKMAICLYQMEKYDQSQGILQELARHEQLKSSQLFYYLGQSQIKMNLVQEGLLNLEYCLRLQTNAKIMRKAYKKLIQVYLENYQFYEALNIIKLGDICGLSLESWSRTVESFMLVIKGQYEEGLAHLSKICEQIKSNEENRRVFKIKRDSSEDKPKRENRFHFESHSFNKKVGMGSPSRGKDNFSKDRINRKLGYFSTKSVTRAIPKIESTRININPPYALKKEDTFKLKTEHSPTQHEQLEKPTQLFSSKEKEIIYPLILQFKAYAEFFSNNFIRCMDTYEQYQSYIKDVYGRESDVVYNKCLCEALLMAESDMQDEALLKYSSCVDLHFQRYGAIPPQPLLYKIILLMRLAIVKNVEEGEDNEEDASFQQILESTLEMADNYEAAIGSHHLAHYYRSLIYILLERYEDSRETLEKTLKITEECSWKFLYVKGVVEMILGNYYDAVKEFSAGLILQNRAQFYLGRSISFLMLGQKQEAQCDSKSIKMLMKSVHISSELTAKETATPKAPVRSDLLIENCFEDLQKYIELQSNQEQISLWVSKILFVNKAYDEAIRSLTKISDQSAEVLSMIQCIEIYEGEFESGGAVGRVIKSAFDGRFLSGEEEGRLLSEKIVKNYNAREFGYLYADYEKWLVVLHLYVRENYGLLLKYLQKEMFACQDDLTQVLLRFNVAVVYLLIGEVSKGLNVVKGLGKYEEKYDLKKRVEKMGGLQYEMDECVQQLREEIGINCNKLLSSYLPFKPIEVVNHRGETIRIYTKINIPFPKFSNPTLELKISSQFILGELTPALIEKKIEAPWIKKIKNKTIQFTEKLEESLCELDDIANSKAFKEPAELEEM